MKDDALAACLRARQAQVKSGRHWPEPEQLALFPWYRHARPEVERGLLADRPRKRASQ